MPIFLKNGNHHFLCTPANHSPTKIINTLTKIIFTVFLWEYKTIQNLPKSCHNIFLFLQFSHFYLDDVICVFSFLKLSLTTDVSSNPFVIFLNTYVQKQKSRKAIFFVYFQTLESVSAQ